MTDETHGTTHFDPKHPPMEIRWPKALSREEILAMPAGPEMDALVAERVFGCKVCPSQDDPYHEWLFVCGCRPTGRAEDNYPHGSYDQEDGYNSCERIASYSTEIAAAMSIVPKLGVAFTLWFTPTGPGLLRGVGASFGGKQASGVEMADSICRAALLTTAGMPK